MKQTYLIFTLVFLLSGAAVAGNYEFKPKPKQGKHKTHKKAKKKKSGYLYNFQH